MFTLLTVWRFSLDFSSWKVIIPMINSRVLSLVDYQCLTSILIKWRTADRLLTSIAASKASAQFHENFLSKVLNLTHPLKFNVKKGKIKKEKIGFVSEVVINALEHLMSTKLWFGPILTSYLDFLHAKFLSNVDIIVAFSLDHKIHTFCVWLLNNFSFRWLMGFSHKYPRKECIEFPHI